MIFRLIKLRGACKCTHYRHLRLRKHSKLSRRNTLVEYSFNENNKLLPIKKPEGPEGNQLNEKLVGSREFNGLCLDSLTKMFHSDVCKIKILLQSFAISGSLWGNGIPC